MRFSRQLYGAVMSLSGAAAIGSRIWEKYPGCKVLNYHSVDDAKRFRSHVAYLSRNYRLIRVSELVDLLERGGTPANDCVCFTFDDGHVTFFERAYPILREFRTPATIFVPTGPVERGEPLWFDAVEGILSVDTSGRARRVLAERFEATVPDDEALCRMKDWSMSAVAETVAAMARFVDGQPWTA
jgi:hypothetical protein